MNNHKLAGMLYKLVRTRPMARRFDENGFELDPIDYKWSIRQGANRELILFNDATHQNVQLGMDHVREYMTDAGNSDGFLILKSQIFLFAPRGATVEPLIP